MVLFKRRADASPTRSVVSRVSHISRRMESAAAKAHRVPAVKPPQNRLTNLKMVPPPFAVMSKIKEEMPTKQEKVQSESRPQPASTTTPRCLPSTDGQTNNRMARYLQKPSQPKNRHNPRGRARSPFRRNQRSNMLAGKGKSPEKTPTNASPVRPQQLPMKTNTQGRNGRGNKSQSPTKLPHPSGRKPVRMSPLRSYDNPVPMQQKKEAVLIDVDTTDNAQDVHTVPQSPSGTVLGNVPVAQDAPSKNTALLDIFIKPTSRVAPASNRIFPNQIVLAPCPQPIKINSNYQNILEAELEWSGDEAIQVPGLEAPSPESGQTPDGLTPDASVDELFPAQLVPQALQLTSTLRGIDFVPATTSSEEPSFSSSITSAASSSLGLDPIPTSNDNKMPPSRINIDTSDNFNLISTMLNPNGPSHTVQKVTASPVCAFTMASTRTSSNISRLPISNQPIEPPSNDLIDSVTQEATEQKDFDSNSNVKTSLSNACPIAPDEAKLVAMQAALVAHKEAEQKAKESPERICPPRPTPEFKVTLLMASYGYQRADSTNPAFMEIIHEIETKQKVRIEVNSEKNRLYIYAQSMKHAVETIQAVKAATWAELPTTRVWCPTILLAPSKVQKIGFKASMELIEDGTLRVVRPVIDPSGGRLAPPHEYNQMMAQWEDQFRTKMFEAAGAMRVRDQEMSMRVHLGTVHLQEWRKNKPTYSHDELQDELTRRGNRGTFDFQWMLGGDGFAYRVLELIYNSPARFEPTDVRLRQIIEVKPMHTLVLQTNNLKIEMDIVEVKGADIEDKALRLGPARGYRREVRREAIQIINAYPASTFDWSLAVESRVPVNGLPFTLREITEATTITACHNPEEFPKVNLTGAFLAKHKVEQIKGKTSWTFSLKENGYALEVSVYNLLAANSNETIASGCGLDIFHPAWQSQLHVHNTAVNGPRNWTESNYSEFFPVKSPRDKDGIKAFLAVIGDIHSFISNLAAKDSPGKVVREGPEAVPDVPEPQQTAEEKAIEEGILQATLAESWKEAEQEEMMAAAMAESWKEAERAMQATEVVIKTEPAENMPDLLSGPDDAPIKQEAVNANIQEMDLRMFEDQFVNSADKTKASGKSSDCDVDGWEQRIVDWQQHVGNQIEAREESLDPLADWRTPVLAIPPSQNKAQEDELLISFD